MLCIISVGDTMNLILSTIMQEKQRIDRMLESYLHERERLPKGTLSEKRVGERTYFYLKHRDGKKVVSQYVPVDTVDEVREQIEHRKHIDAMIRSLQQEQRIAQKVLEEYV